ncbi:MAG: DUF4623 domain-containing protein [Verrucomicrobiota bacterium]
MKGAFICFTLAAGLAAHGQVLFTDDFESGIVDWTANGASGNNLGVSSRNIIPTSGVQSAITLIAGDRAAKTLPTPVIAGEHSIFTAYLYRDSISATVGSTRIPVGVGDSTVAHRFGFGWFNNATALGDTFQSTNYQGKMTDLLIPGNQLFNLNNPGTPRRSIGWHKFDVERTADGTVRFYVDDVLGRTVPPDQYTNSLARSWSSVVVGFGTTSSVGGEAGYDGLSVVKDPPLVSTQPANQLVTKGSDATFSVGATGGTLTYQWRKSLGGTNSILPIAGATSSTLTITNVGTNDVRYFYSVVTSNANGSVGSAAATLTISAPYFVTEPTNQFAVQGSHPVFTAAASGAPTLTFQWQFNSVNIPGATTASYTNFNVTTASEGVYQLVVSNPFGSVTSAPVTLTVFANPNPDVVAPLWKVNTANTWFNTSGSTTRGMTYYAPSNQVLVVSRKEVAGGRVYVLDAQTGATLHFLNEGIGIIAGGFFAQNVVAVDGDGKIYVANLELNAASTPFKIYRYDNTDPATEPVLFYQGDPGSGTQNRWGDTITARGTGVDARILVGSRNGIQFALINATDASATTINVTGLGADQFGLGLAFGAGDTFWAKVNGGTPLYHIGFDGVILHSYANLDNGGPIGVDPVGARLAMNFVGSENPDNMRLYSISNLSSAPVLLDFEFYNHPADNSPTASFGTGNIVFGPNGRIYAFNENQGLMALAVPAPVLNITRSGNDVVLSWTGTYTLLSSTTIDGTYTVVTTVSPYIESVSSASAKFFKLQ